MWYSYSFMAVPPAHPIEVREKAFQLYREKKTHVEIGVALAIPPETVRKWSYKCRWKERAQSLAKNRINPGENREQKQVAEEARAEAERIANMSLSERQTDFEEKMSIQAMRLPAMMATMDDDQLLAAAEKITKLAGEARKALKLEKEKPSLIVNVGLLAQPVATPALPAPEKQEEVIEIEAEPVEQILLAG